MANKQGILRMNNIWVPHLRILAESAPAVRVVALEVYEESPIFHYSKLLGDVCKMYADTIRKLALDSGALLICGDQFAGTPGPHFSNVQTLHLQVEEIGVYEDMQEDAQFRRACDFVAAIPNVNSARITFDALERSDWDRPSSGTYQNTLVIDLQQLHVILSLKAASIRELHLVYIAEAAVDLLQQAIIFQHYSGVEHLILESLEAPIILHGILPLRLLQLTVRSVRAMEGHLHTILADPMQLPVLRNVPELYLCGDPSDYWEYFEDHPSVERAIAGMRARGTVQDLDTASHRICGLQYVS